MAAVELTEKTNGEHSNTNIQQETSLTIDAETLSSLDRNVVELARKDVTDDVTLRKDVEISSNSSSRHSSHDVFDGKIRITFEECSSSECSDMDGYSEKQPMTWREFVTILSPHALQTVKEQLKNNFGEKAPSETPLTPAEKWERKKQLLRKVSLPKIDQTKIKAGFNVRLKLEELKRTNLRSIQDLYWELVKSGNSVEVQALFNISVTHQSYQFNRNSVDDNEKSTLRVAIENHDLEMCEVLLKNQVSVKDCILHAIQRNYYEAVEAILKSEKVPKETKEFCVNEENYYFDYGTRPFLLAACNNNYKILELLYREGHQIPELHKNSPFTWELETEQRLICRARASPAYITLFCEDKKNGAKKKKKEKLPLEYCIDEIVFLRKQARIRHELRSFYKDLQNQIEDYMCELLDQVKSSRELARVFSYDHEDSWFKHGFKGTSHELSTAPKINLLNSACEKKLTKFVTHHNFQTALTHLSYRDTQFLHNATTNEKSMFILFVGLFFPVLCLLYIIAPKCKAGKFILRPHILYGCHVVSNFTFFGILLASVVTKSAEHEYLGAPPTILEWAILAFVCGKLAQELRELYVRGFSSYFEDWWNYNDIIQILLFAVCIVFKIFDYLMHRDDAVRIYRANWTVKEPRLWCVGLLGWAYVFAFLRVLGLGRLSKTFGPLTASLSRMMINVVQFLFLFFLILFAFALGLTELYWYYSTPKGLTLICKSSNTSNLAPKCDRIHFSDISQSVLDLFWALFGYLELSSLSIYGNHQLIETIGMTLVGTYQVIAIIILINMLIAMMARSFDVISENRDAEWKLNRAQIWVAFIRRDLKFPPPMNLIPNPYEIHRFFITRGYKTLDKSFMHSVRKEKHHQMEKTLLRRYKFAILVD